MTHTQFRDSVEGCIISKADGRVKILIQELALAATSKERRILLQLTKNKECSNTKSKNIKLTALDMI